MRKTCLPFVVAFLLVIAFVPTLPLAARNSTVVLVNGSDWDLYHLYLSSTENEEWGPDQLGDHVLESGGTFTLHSIPCDYYDLQVVDEDGDACVIEEIELCGDEVQWVITNKELLACEWAS